MAPRRRKSENSDLPQGLSAPTKRRPYYRFRFPNGQDFYFPAGTTRQDAREAAIRFNDKHRNPTIKLIQQGDNYNRPLSYWIPKVKKRVEQEENLGSNAWSTFETDCERLLEFGGNVYSKSIDLEFVNAYLDKYTSGKSANVYNRKISFLKKVFSYLVDMSAMLSNFAESKKTKPKPKKARQRLQLDALMKIYDAAPDFLKIGIAMALETTHASLEISRVKYRDCRWLKEPVMEFTEVVYGYLRIHRQKVQHLEASYVEIPISLTLKRIIEQSKDDRVLSPYIIHRIGRFRDQIGEGCDHPTQVSSKYLSRAFSALRDELGLYGNLSKEQRPTFHEIRALSAKMYDDKGIDPQGRMAHSDAKSTKIYTENHVNWTRVPAGQLDVF